MEADCATSRRILQTSTGRKARRDFIPRNSRDGAEVSLPRPTLSPPRRARAAGVGISDRKSEGQEKAGLPRSVPQNHLRWRESEHRTGMPRQESG